MTEKKLKKESANDIKIGMVARKETILIMKKHILISGQSRTFEVVPFFYI